MKYRLAWLAAFASLTIACVNDETVNPASMTSSSSSSGSGGGDAGLPQPVADWVIDPEIFVSGQDHVTESDCRTQICRHNENTDLFIYKGSTFLVHRTAYSQILGPNSSLLIYKSTDRGATFTETARIPAVDGRDIRDPHFFQVGDTLFIETITRLPVMSTRDSNVESITMVMSTTDGRTWSKLTPVAPKTWSFWRVKEQASTFYSAAYEDGDKGVVLFSSTDGLAWTMGAPIYTKSADTPLETELTFMKSGKVLALVRTDGDNDQLLGNVAPLKTHVCWADPPYDTFDCPQTLVGQRLDGPVSFFWGERLFVLARRNMLGIQCKKRTALFEITGDFQNGKTIALKDWGDIPSAGDTSYSGVAPVDGHTFVTTWYSGDLLKDESWATGIFEPTDIWKANLDLSKLK